MQNKVQDLREKLYRAAKADPKRRFHSLRDKLWRKDILHEAWKMVKKNKGAARADGITIAEIEKKGVEEFLIGGHLEYPQSRTE